MTGPVDFELSVVLSDNWFQLPIGPQDDVSAWASSAVDRALAQRGMAESPGRRMVWEQLYAAEVDLVTVDADPTELVAAYLLVPAVDVVPVTVVCMQVWSVGPTGLDGAVESVVLPPEQRYGAPEVDELVTQAGVCVRLRQSLFDSDKDGGFLQIAVRRGDLRRDGRGPRHHGVGGRQMTGLAAGAGAGLSYRMVVPEAWVRLPANPLAMRTAARSYLLRRYSALPRDETLATRRRLEDQLVKLADDAARNQGIDLLLLDVQVNGQASGLTASCLVSLTPLALSDEPSLQALAATCAASAVSSAVLDLGSHRVCRVVREEVDQPHLLVPPEQERETVTAVLTQARTLGVLGLPATLNPEQVRAYARP